MLVGATAVSVAPTLTEMLVAAPLAPMVAIGIQALVMGRFDDDGPTILAVLSGASYLPMVLVARYVVIPAANACPLLWDALRDHLPLWLFALLVLCYVVMGCARVAGWAVQSEETVGRWRLTGLIAFCGFWLPFWVWVLVSVEPPGELLDHATPFVLLGLITVAGYIITRSLERRFIRHG